MKISDFNYYLREYSIAQTLVRSYSHSREINVSYDLAIWFPNPRLSDEQALEQYHKLCDEDISELTPHPSISRFYLELYKIHPEVDDVPDNKIEDFDFCPWSVQHDLSDRHLMLSCVWSHAGYVRDLILLLAKKHGLAVFDPQLIKIHYPTDP